MKRVVKIVVVLAVVWGVVYGVAFIRSKIEDKARIAEFRLNEVRVKEILADNEKQLVSVETLLVSARDAVVDERWPGVVGASGEPVGKLSPQLREALGQPKACFVIWRHELLGENIPKGFVQTMAMRQRDRIGTWMEYPSDAVAEIEWLQKTLDKYVASVKRKYIVVAQVDSFKAAKVVTVDNTSKTARWLATPGRVDFTLGIFDAATLKLIAKTKGFVESTIANPGATIQNNAYDVLSEDLWTNAREENDAVLAAELPGRK